jgi:hypothetical protein
MKTPFQWRKPTTYLHVAGKVRARAAAGLRRKGKELDVKSRVFINSLNE